MRVAAPLLDRAGPALCRLPFRKAKLAAFIASPRVRAEPWSLYAELQQRAPVLRTRFGATIVSRHADVTTVLRQRSASVDESKATAFAQEQPDTAFGRLVGRSMLFQDPPEHERLRRLVSRAFTPRRVAELRGATADIVERRLAALDAAGSTDLVDTVAYPVPVDVIAALLGVPERDHRPLRRWAAALAARIDVGPMRNPEVERAGDQAAVELDGYLRALASSPSLRVPGGLLEDLLDAAADDRLTLDEAVSSAALLLVAGHETTSNLLSAGLLALLERPAELARLRAGAVAATATDELVRFTSPVQLSLRVATEPLELSAGTVAPGELVALLIGAANRDPAVFDEPDQLDLGRTPNPHIGFGTGIHACLGAALARLEADVALPALVTRWPRLRLAGRPRWRPTFVLRGLVSLPVRWD